jgi:DNA invertase Pin-like site-specific DNA recombinase
MAKPQQLISYLRVSTDKQGIDGLGLQAQRTAVWQHVHGSGGELLTEYVEVESGRSRDRPELHRALAACRLHSATLIVAKLDRLARNASFLLSLKDAGIDFVCADMPHANRLTVGILACVAEEEARLISERTKAALAVAKSRGVRLGNPQHLTMRARADGTQASARSRRASADARAQDLKPLLEEIAGQGRSSLRHIAGELTARGVPTARGRAVWTAAQVDRVLRRC